MTHEKLRQALEQTRDKFMPWQAMGTARYPLDQKVWSDATGRLRAIEHLKWMTAEALTWGPERAEKMNRWLGFIQGALWAFGYATIDELREVNLGPEEPS